MATDAKAVTDGLMFHPNNPSQFNSKLPRIYDIFLTDFGRHGRALVPGIVAPAPVKPTVNDLDSSGQRLYTLAKTQDAQGTFGQADFVPAVYGPDLTLQSHELYKRALGLYDVEVAFDLLKLPLLVSWLIKHCSEGSRQALECRPLWHTSKNASETEQMWTLILEVHQFGNEQASLTYLRDFVTSELDLSTSTLDAYISSLRVKLSLVVASYEDPKNPGFISTDRLYKAIFLLGLDTTIFSDVVRRFQDEHPTGTAADAMHRMQTFYRDRVVPISSKATSDFLSRSLVAEVKGLPKKIRKPPIPENQLTDQHCRFCAANGYHQFHTLPNCEFKKRADARRAPGGPAKSSYKDREHKSPKASSLIASAPSIAHGQMLCESMQMYLDSRSTHRHVGFSYLGSSLDRRTYYIQWFSLDNVLNG